MVKVRSVFCCGECGTSSPKWVGRCPGCGAWNTLTEEVASAHSSAGSIPSEAVDRPLPITEVAGDDWEAESTGISELDRVLGGGLVRGSVTLVGGEPGIGKSTLLMHLAAASAAHRKVLYVSAEESRQQVRLRAERLEALHPQIWLSAEGVLGNILAGVEEIDPDVLVVDSIQAVHDPELGSAPGSVGQVRACAHQLVQVAKRRGMATILVGHVTKDGSLAGPRVLEHVVDTVLAFEGDRHHALRLLRAVKHRFGSTQELGLFEMGDAGLEGVPDPSGLFLADRRHGSPGSVVVPTIEGHRPLLVELQALVARSSLPAPRRSAQGLDAGRLALLLAVLERRAGLGALATSDVYALAVGGVRVVEPGADLGVALAVASALVDRSLPAGLVACGEIGLAGELRQVGQTARRLAEAARLGFTHAVVPTSAPSPPVGMEVLRASTLAEAIDTLQLLGAASGPALRSVSR
ncbi:MAG: DNA repair protein RadA [Actinomycetota bacterium]|nr:DNA repair protein RadA [Actinomycetota bacterium]